MKNWKKWIFIAIIAVAVIILFTIKIYGVSEVLTKSEIQSPNTLENKRKIASAVLQDTGRNDMFEPQEALNVTVYAGNLMGGDQNQAILSVRFGPKNTIVAVYNLNEDGETYSYVGDLGEFFDVKNIQFMPLKDGRNIAIVREYADQNIGAFERSSFLKGYLWNSNTKDFDNVLSIPEGIETVWNGAWDDSSVEERRWQRIEQRTEIQYEDNPNPVINLTHYQAYKISDSKDTDNMPDLSTFDTYKSRVVNETYYWSDEWQRFILAEKMNNATGEKVAVIEDFGSSPYALLADYGDAVNNLMIKTEGGKYEIVKRDTLSNLDGTPATNLFNSYQN